MTTAPAAKLDVPEGYRSLDETTLPGYLAGLPDLAARLGGGAERWTVREVGDGNLNLVFIVEGPAGSLCVKQALPYLRLVGEGWPLPLERAFFEHEALVEEARHAPRHVPAVYHYDPGLFLIVMEHLRPHIIMRRGMIDGVRYPRFADHIAEFMARTLFHSSDLALAAAEKKRRMALFCANTELCKITEDLIFTEPYMAAERNRWTTPQLDADAAAIREDRELKIAVSELKLKFLGRAEAMIHGDLHTGSIMVTQDETHVIDPEFAFFGPMGFDTGAVVGNLLINFFSQDGHATGDDPREDYQDWVLAQVEAVWAGFAERFLKLWQGSHTGDAYPDPLFAGRDGSIALAGAQAAYMERLFRDTLAFGAAKMIRRILGIAHNIDLEWIEDPDLRAVCERRCLRLAREMMVNTARYRTPADVTAAARAVRAEVA